MKKIILIFLISLINNVYSQKDIKRIYLYDDKLDINFTRRYSEYSLGFKSPLCCEGDTIFVNVFSDSINVEKITFNLFVQFPKNINALNTTMILEYTDKTEDILYQITFPDSENCVQYFILNRLYQSITTKKVKRIVFRGIQSFKIKDKTFFIDFYNKIK
jgi:hypothetical protein